MHASVTRKRQLVAVARVVMMFDSFSMGRVSGQNSGTVYSSATLLARPRPSGNSTRTYSSLNAPEGRSRVARSVSSWNWFECPLALEGRQRIGNVSRCRPSRARRQIEHSHPGPYGPGYTTRLLRSHRIELPDGLWLTQQWHPGLHHTQQNNRAQGAALGKELRNIAKALKGCNQATQTILPL